MLLRTAGHVRLAPNGMVIGLDFGLALQLAETLGYDIPAIADLLPEAEVGLVKALNEQLGCLALRE